MTKDTYDKEFKEGVFPTSKHVYNMTEGEMEKLRAELGIKGSLRN